MRLLAAIASWFASQFPSDKQIALQERIRMQRMRDNEEWKRERVASRGQHPAANADATQHNLQGEIA